MINKEPHARMIPRGTDSDAEGHATMGDHRPGRLYMPFAQFLILSASLCLCGSSSVFAESAPTIIRKGNEQYRAGEFAGALKTYESAAKADPKSLEARFNQGVAAYKANDIELAERLFREVDSTGGNPALASAARYNLGVVETQRLRAAPPSDPEKALESLKSAASMFRGSLDLSPRDADAARNLELTRMAIKDLREQIERQKELQRQMQELKDQLKQNQKEQEQASQQNQERSADQQSDQEQKQEAQEQQEQVSKQTQQAQKKLNDLKKQMGEGDSGEQEQKAQESEEEQGDDETPEAQRVGEEPSPQEKLENASESLEAARDKQEQAQERIEHGDLSGAEKEQKEAAGKIKKALEDLAGEQGENQDQQDQEQPPQPDEAPEAQPEEGQQQVQPPPPEQKEGEPMEQKEGEGESSADARLGRILEKERKDRELKQQVLKKQRARNRPVDKDW